MHKRTAKRGSTIDLEQPVHYWWSWGEYVDELEAEHARGRHGSESHALGNPTWSGTENFQQALDLARKGWDESLPEVERVAGLIEAKVEAVVGTTGFESTYDTAGSEVDVSLYLAGEPECMIESTPIRVSRHGRAVRLAIGSSFLANVSHDAVIRRGAAVVALADALAKAQHPLEVWWVNNADVHRGYYCQAVRIQAADEPLDVPRLLFGFAHPAAQRRLAFHGRECWSGAREVGGTRDIWKGFLPDEADNTIVLQPLAPRDRWTDEQIVGWVVKQLEAIFD